MSEIQEIDVMVKPDGTIKIEVRGVKGEKCLALTEKLEKTLGGSIVDRTYTDEFYQNEQELEQEDRMGVESGKGFSGPGSKSFGCNTRNESGS
jgi:hypothetical protein